MKTLETIGLNKLKLNKKLIALILAVIGILCTLFITDDEGTRTIIKLLIQLLNTIQSTSPTPIPEF